jgi:hypothetical protein
MDCTESESQENLVPASCAPWLHVCFTTARGCGKFSRLYWVTPSPAQRNVLMTPAIYV